MHKHYFLVKNLPVLHCNLNIMIPEYIEPKEVICTRSHIYIFFSFKIAIEKCLNLHANVYATFDFSRSNNIEIGIVIYFDMKNM